MQITQRPIRIFGVPMDLGQQRRGVDMGASAVRYAGLQPRLERLGFTVNDAGNLFVPISEQLDTTPEDGRAHNMQAISDVCRNLYTQVKTALNDGETVITLGGDHSISLGTAAAAADCAGNVGVLWIDAHGDFNTPQTTPSGNVHGMVVAALMGRCPPPLTLGEKMLTAGQMAMIGTRDLDREERVELAASGITVMTMRAIDERGVADTMRAVLAGLADCDALHISLDLDSLDPQVATGVGTPVPGGLTQREAHLIMEMLADDGRVRSLDIVEVNPILDTRNHTAEIAVDLAASLFGQRIL